MNIRENIKGLGGFRNYGYLKHNYLVSRTYFFNNQKPRDRLGVWVLSSLFRMFFRNHNVISLFNHLEGEGTKD
jgi:hypothetical protein